MEAATPTIQTRLLNATDAAALGDLFVAAAMDPEVSRYFHPHPLRRSFAADLCGLLERIRDRYFGMFVGDRMVGYGMLRGWDEGYSVPSFGVCVHPELRDVGIGQELTAFAARLARIAGAERMRLTVYKANARAVHIYSRYGFKFAEKDADSLVGVADVADLPTTPSRPVNTEKLLAWSAAQSRPLRLGVWCAYGVTLVPNAGIGVFVYNLLDGLLARPEAPDITIAVRPGDQHLLDDVVRKGGGRVRVIPGPPPPTSPRDQRMMRVAAILDRCKRAVRRVTRAGVRVRHRLLGALRSRAVAPARRAVWAHPWLILPLLPAGLAFLLLRAVARAAHRGTRVASRLAYAPFRRLEREIQRRLPAPRVDVDPHTGVLAEANSAGCDVWVYPYLGVPHSVGDHASVVFVHDMVCSRFPEHFRKNDVLALERMICNRVREATLVGCMSEFIRANDLTGLLGLPDKKVRMIRPAAPRDFPTINADEADQLLSAKLTRDFLLYPAGLRGYKNHAVLIEALQLLRDEHGEGQIDLVFTGGDELTHRAEILAQARSAGLNAQVHILGNVSRKELAALYKTAFATIVPSLYEQGSFPIYEALHYGCPVACSDIPPLREQCGPLGDAMPFFDPLDSRSVADAILALRKDRTGIRAAQAAAARAINSRTWTEVADEWLAVFRQAATMHASPETRVTIPAAPTEDQPLKLGVWMDYGGTLTPNEGIGVYIHSLLHGFLDLPDRIELTVLGRWGDETTLDALVARAGNRLRILPGANQRLAHPTDLVKASGCHLWLLPYVGFHYPIDFPAIVILHDLVTIHYPEAFSPDFVDFTNRLARTVTHQSLRVVCVSQVLAQLEAREYLNLPDEKIRVIYSAIPAPFPAGTSAGEPDVAVFRNLKRPFIFYPAAFRPYMNHVGLLHAMRVLREEFGETDIDLVFTGPNIRPPEDIRELIQRAGLKRQVHVLGKLDRMTVDELYRQALGMVFPSKFEGCGLPIYEAIAHGCPVSCSDIPVLREQFAVMGDSIPFFRPNQPRSIARAILHLKDRRDEILAAQAAQRPKLLARGWADVAADFVRLAREVVGVAPPQVAPAGESDRPSIIPYTRTAA